MTTQVPIEKFCRLDQLQKGDKATILGLAEPTDNQPAFIRSRLMELGFIPGEKISILAKSILGCDPIAIRVGDGTFALRNLEASMVFVDPNR